MKPLLPPKPRSYTGRRIARFVRYFSPVCLTPLGLVLAASTAYALNHPPTISWIPDQRIMSDGFSKKYFTILDYDAGDTISISISSSKTTFYSAGDIAIDACSQTEKN